MSDHTARLRHTALRWSLRILDGDAEAWAGDLDLLPDGATLEHAQRATEARLHRLGRMLVGPWRQAGDEWVATVNAAQARTGPQVQVRRQVGHRRGR